MDRIEELTLQFSREPLAVTLGASLDMLKDGQAVVSAVARDDLLIVSGILQGGVTCIIADYAGVYAAMTKIPTGLTPAVHISLDLYHPIRRSERFIATARVVVDNRALVRVEVDVSTEKGRSVASSSIIFAKPKA